MSPSEPRVAYVVKMYPRFSETFVVSEILAREAQGEQLEIVSLRLPVDGRFHEALAEVRAPVHYLSHGSVRGADLWERLREAGTRWSRLTDHLPDLLALEVEDAIQALELAVLVQERGIEHLHAHFASVATTVARVAAAVAGVTYSFTAHAKDIFHEGVDPADLEAKLADAHHVVTVSDYNLRHLRTLFPLATSRLHRVYNGLDLVRFTPVPATRRAGVVAVGRLVEKKGFDVLVDAISLLHRAGRDVPCTIAGDGALAGALRDQVDLAGVGHLVTFAGPLPQSAVRGLVGEAMALAAPCVVGRDGNADGLPTVLLEALALGTPCVATTVTGIPEAIRHGQTGLLVPPGDARALAHSLAQLLDDPDLRRGLALAGRSLVEREFDSRTQAAALRRLLPQPPAALRTPRTAERAGVVA